MSTGSELNPNINALRKAEPFDCLLDYERVLYYGENGKLLISPDIRPLDGSEEIRDGEQYPTKCFRLKTIPNKIGSEVASDCIECQFHPINYDV